MSVLCVHRTNLMHLFYFKQLNVSFFVRRLGEDSAKTKKKYHYSKCLLNLCGEALKVFITILCYLSCLEKKFLKFVYT